MLAGNQSREFRLQVLASPSGGLWFQCQFHFQSLCIATLICSMCLQPSGQSEMQLAVYNLAQFSNLCCGVQDHMHACAAQRELLSQASPSLKYPQYFWSLGQKTGALVILLCHTCPRAASRFRARRQADREKKHRGLPFPFGPQLFQQERNFLLHPSFRHLQVPPCYHCCCCHCHRIAWGLRLERRDNNNNKEKLRFLPLPLSVRNPLSYLLSQNQWASLHGTLSVHVLVSTLGVGML